MRFPFTIHKTNWPAGLSVPAGCKIVCVAVLTLKLAQRTVRMCPEKRIDHRDGLKCKDVERLCWKKEEKVDRSGGRALINVEQRGQMSRGREKVRDEWMGRSS